MNGRDAFVLVRRSVKIRHAHTAQAEREDSRPTGSELALMRGHRPTVIRSVSIDKKAHRSACRALTAGIRSAGVVRSSAHVAEPVPHQNDSDHLHKPARRAWLSDAIAKSAAVNRRWESSELKAKTG